jgi:hypothetical protein
MYTELVSFIKWIYPPLTGNLVELSNVHSEASPLMVGGVEVSMLPYAPGKTHRHVTKVIAMKSSTFF